MDYTYDEYLNHWRREFGDVQRANTHYYRGNKRVAFTVVRISEKRFDEILDILDDLTVKYDLAQRNDDLERMSELLVEMFPYEITLLI